MVREISIKNKSGTIAKCLYKYITIKKEINPNPEYKNIRVLKYGYNYSINNILSNMSLNEYVDKLSKNEISDIDIKHIGTIINKCNKVIVYDKQVVNNYIKKLKIVNEKGEIIKNEEFIDVQSNVGEDLPLTISDISLEKEDICKKLLISRKIQLIHKDDLTFKFLMDLAKEIGNKIVMVGSGKKGNKPIIFTKNGTPYRGFLQASVENESYKLVIHLSNMEILVPQKVKDENY